MITDEELMRSVSDISKSASIDQNKTLDKIAMIVRHATKAQIQSCDPRVLLTCILRILLQYEYLLHMNGLCEWKRRRKFKTARHCYYILLKSYLPERSREVVQTIVRVIRQDQLWKFETFCFEIMCSLLDIGSVSGGLITHTVWDMLASPDIGVEEARGIAGILCEFLNVYDWPATQDTVATVEKILRLFHTSITAQSTTADSSTPLMGLKKSLEICLRNILKHLANEQILVIVQHMCSWTVAADATDDIILEFGSTLEYAAYTHQAGLYEQTLTPIIFPLLMQMVGSSNQLTSLLGNRVLQYLLDRKNNRAFFEVPKIFFEHTRLDLYIVPSRKEDVLFLQLHREVLHDSLLKSLMNHLDSRMNLEMTYCTICLIAVEVPCGFTAAALVCLVMNMQEIILQKYEIHLPTACHVHAMIISIMSLLCWIHKAQVFYSYVNRILMERARWAPHLNPPLQSQYKFVVHYITWNKRELFFDDWEARYGLWKCFRSSDSQDAMSLIIN